MDVGFPSSGNLISGAKDANPSPGASPNWSSLAWTAGTPANTSVNSQIAASNNAAGPFNFVGPDGTTGTFFSNGASLAQFNGFSYLKYKALLGSTNNTVTPAVNDVTVCFSNIASVTSLAINSAAGPFNGTTTLAATLTTDGNGVSGKSISFTLNGNNVGSATTDVNGLATLSKVSLAGINTGSYPNGVGASFAGNAGYTTSSDTNALTVNMADQTITFAPLADKTVGDPDLFVSATATSGLPVSFSALGQCSVGGKRCPPDWHRQLHDHGFASRRRQLQRRARRAAFVQHQSAERERGRPAHQRVPPARPARRRGRVHRVLQQYGSAVECLDDRRLAGLGRRRLRQCDPAAFHRAERHNDSGARPLPRRELWLQPLGLRSERQ